MKVSDAEISSASSPLWVPMSESWRSRWSDALCPRSRLSSHTITRDGMKRINPPTWMVGSPLLRRAKTCRSEHPRYPASSEVVQSDCFGWLPQVSVEFMSVESCQLAGRSRYPIAGTKKRLALLAGRSSRFVPPFTGGGTRRSLQELSVPI